MHANPETETRHSRRHEPCSIMPPAAEVSPPDPPSRRMPCAEHGCRGNRTPRPPRVRIHGRATNVRLRSGFRCRALPGTCPGSPGIQVSPAWMRRDVREKHYGGPATCHVSMPTRPKDDSPPLQVDSESSAKTTIGASRNLQPDSGFHAYRLACLRQRVEAARGRPYRPRFIPAWLSDAWLAVALPLQMISGFPLEQECQGSLCTRSRRNDVSAVDEARLPRSPCLDLRRRHAAAFPRIRIRITDACCRAHTQT